MTYGDPVMVTRRILAAALTVATVTTSAPLAFATPSTAPEASPVPPALASFYAQSLEWSGCGSDQQCAWLTVPRDYDDPTGATIRLRVSRVTASGTPEQRIGSLVVNPGGPGASGLDFAGYVAGMVSPPVAAAYDVVGFDTRGVGRSAPITCMTGRQTTRYLRADASPDTRIEERQLMSLGRRLAQGCLEYSPAIARHVGSDDTVRDMDVLRAALRDDRLNFLGFSYGTYLGTLYAEEFPENVGRLVLDGAIDPSLDLMEVSRGQSGGFQTAMRRFAADCAPRPGCPWRGSASTVLTGINRLLARLDRQPMPTHRGANLVQAEALTALFYSMYSPLMWPTLRVALRQAKAGDGLGLQAMADYASDRVGPNTYATNMASAFPAISCWDAPPPPGIDGLRDAATDWAVGARVPDMARAMAWGNASCSQWFGHSGRVPAPASSATTAPIVVIGTTFDPATPYAWAQALAAQLSTSTLLTFRGDGHTAFGGNSDCIDAAVNAYLLSGAPPAAGTVCR